ncbi:MAG TPA: hypothetical protein VHS29_10275, partial [Candidatus Acidoferrales bacterium]|nr:hypothetical protein [Candidatus Acidoferrales bacterium]
MFFVPNWEFPKIVVLRLSPLSQRQDNQHWINPLLSELKLIEIKVEVIDPKVLWGQIEQNRLLERISKLVAEINDAAGYHVLEMLEFLAPQRKILFISFDRKSVQYKMELLIRNQGIFLIFGTVRRSTARWERYFGQCSRNENYAKVWEHQVRPDEVMGKDIQSWFS